MYRIGLLQPASYYHYWLGMFERIKNHLFTLHEKIGLLAIYGIIMFVMGMGLNHLFYGDAGNDFDQAYEQPEQQLPTDMDETIDGKEVMGDVLTEPEEPSYSEYVVDLVVKKGDTFSKLLVKAGLDKDDAYHASQAMGKVYNLRNLKVGQKMVAVFQEGEVGSGEEGALEFVRLLLEEPERTIELTKSDGRKFVAQDVKKELTQQVVHAGGVIQSSLYLLANSLQIPPNIMAEAINAYSFDVDFQRDITKGTRFEVLYEVFYDQKGNKVQEGSMLYALLTIDGERKAIYHYSPSGDDSDTDYYTEDGRTLRRSLMKTPINGAVVSSPFGKRRHPISGYTRMHKGVDFAAPRGTPVYAAGDGKIERIGRNGGYGNYVRIRHNSEYSTAYAHLSRYAKGMRKGRKVKQGQVIAYVGSTGASTGPHLHYEILRDNKQVNPMKVNMPPGRKLSGAVLKRFEQHRKQTHHLLDTAVQQVAH